MLKKISALIMLFCSFEAYSKCSVNLEINNKKSEKVIFKYISIKTVTSEKLAYSTKWLYIDPKTTGKVVAEIPVLCGFKYPVIWHFSDTSGDWIETESYKLKEGATLSRTVK